MRYKSCIHIESGMNFGDKSLTFCCAGINTRPVLFEYHGENYPAERIEESRKKLIAQLNAPDCEWCQNCPELEMRDWPERDGKLKSLVLNHFRECTLDCCYCGIGRKEYQKEWRNRKDRYSFFPVLQDIINQGLLHEDAMFHWGGGEPAITKDFDALVDTIDGMKLRQLINTNATVFSPALENTLRHGLATCQISVDSGTPETYARIKGRDLHGKVWENIRRYVSVEPNVAIKYILMEGNNSEEEVLAFIRKCLNVGVRKINISLNNRDLREDSVTVQTIKAAALMQIVAEQNGISANVMADYFQRYAKHVAEIAKSMLRMQESGEFSKKKSGK